MSLNPNKNIILVVETDSGLKHYRSRVEDATDNTLLVAAPIENKHIVPLHLQTRVIVSYIQIDLKEQGRYQAEGIVSDRYRFNNLPMLKITLVSTWKKIQLRDYVRVQTLIEGKYNDSNSCIIKDISGGGLMFFSKEQIEEGTEVIFDFMLDDFRLGCKGKIVRAQPTDEGFDYGVVFIDIDEQTRQEVIRYVYQRQLKIYSKEKS